MTSSLASLWAWLAVKIKKNYFLLADHQLAENLILVFNFYESTKKECKFLTKFVGIIVAIIFI